MGIDHQYFSIVNWLLEYRKNVFMSEKFETDNLVQIPVRFKTMVQIHLFDINKNAFSD